MIPPVSIGLATDSMQIKQDYFLSGTFPGRRDINQSHKNPLSKVGQRYLKFFSPL